MTHPSQNNTGGDATPAMTGADIEAMVAASRRLLREAELDGMDGKAGWDCWMGNLRIHLAPFTAAKETP